MSRVGDNTAECWSVLEVVLGACDGTRCVQDAMIIRSSKDSEPQAGGRDGEVYKRSRRAGPKSVPPSLRTSHEGGRDLRIDRTRN